MRFQGFLTAGLLLATVTSGCQCIDDNNVNFTPDPEPKPKPDPVIPPVFPLKAGDTLVLQPIGGRTDASDIGDSDFAIKGTWNIKSVDVNDDDHWAITSDVIYELSGTPSETATSISRLALENVADFPAIESGGSVVAESAIFTTDVPPFLDANYKPNNFPFFQGGLEGNDGDDGEVFNNAAADFREFFTGLDADADVETQISQGKMEVFFRDDVGGPAMLHKILIQVHPMGFICGWDEGLIPFVEGAPRSQSAFNGVDDPPLVAINFASPTLTRDGVSYTCSCFAGTCRNSQSNTCLDPTDPDAAPGECP